MFRTMGMAGLLVAGATAQDWHFLEPPVRQRTAMVFDSALGRTVEFGGWYAYSSGLAPVSLNDTWGFDGQRWRQVFTSNSPSPRTSHAMAYDSVRRRTVLFGGVSSIIPNTPALADTWEFDGVGWMQITTANTPSARFAHAMTFDVARGRTVLFGGYDPGATTYLNDTWEYDGVHWSQIATTSAPTPRVGHAITYDAARGRTVLFGGYRPITLLGDTWEYDGSNWTQVATAASPSTRAYAAMTFDSARGRSILFGGSRGGLTYQTDTWEYDGVNWNQLQPATTPGQQADAVIAYDPGRNRIVLTGAGTGQNIQPQPSTWDFDGATWTRVAAMTLPPGQFYQQMAYDSGRERSLLFGVGPSTSSSLVTWEYDGGAWQLVTTPTAPSARRGHGVAFDSARGRTVLFGGSDAQSVRLNDTWEYSGVSWKQRRPPVSPPPRQDAGCAYDSGRDRVVVFGGTGNGGTLTDTWEYDGATWFQVVTSAAPIVHGKLVYDTARGRTVLFTDHTSLNQTWEYDGTNWLQISTANSPPARTSPALAYDAWRGRTLLYGGRARSGVAADTWEYDGSDWSPVATASSPAAREYASMVFDLARGNTVLFGGITTFGSFPQETVEFVPAATASWTRHGVGCPGSGGVPALDAATVPALGAPFTLNLTTLPAQPGAAWLTFGFDLLRWNTVNLPMALDPFGLPGCKLWVAPAPGAAILLAHPGLARSFTFVIPANPALAGLLVGTQAFVFDAALPTAIGTLSNGGIMRLH